MRFLGKPGHILLTILAILLLLPNAVRAQTCEIDLGVSFPPSGDAQSFVDRCFARVNGGVFFSPECEPPFTIEWDWGDGTTSESFFPAEHEYASPGVYTVTVTATDGTGGVGSATGSMAVLDCGSSERPRCAVGSATVRLDPGVTRGFTLGPSSARAAFLVEATPVAASTEGAYIETRIQPEFNGSVWTDVLRVSIPEGISPLPVQLTLYDLLPGALEDQSFDTTLEPGEFHGFVLRETGAEGVLIAEVSPLSASVSGAHVQSSIQPEFDGETWYDVLRLQIPGDVPSLDVNVRVYEAGQSGLFRWFFDYLEPGVSSGFAIRPSSRGQVYLASVEVWDELGAQVETVIRPEFDGSDWNDVLRWQTQPGDPGVNVVALVYSVPPCPGLELETWGDCPGSIGVGLWDGAALGSAAVAWSPAVGETTLPAGPCAGTKIDLANPTLLTTIELDEGGTGFLGAELPAPACGLYLQALDLETCLTTSLDRIPDE